jgi:hypothetical protein
MDLVEFGLMMRIFLSAGTILSFVTTALEKKCRVRGRAWIGNFCVILYYQVFMRVFALLDINDQEAAKTERFGLKSDVSAVATARLSRSALQQWMRTTGGFCA